MCTKVVNSVSMADSVRISARALVLFVGAWVLLNGGQASAGYLAADCGGSHSPFFTSDSDALGSADSDQGSSFDAGACQVQIESADFSDQPGSPYARHNPWSAFVPIVMVRAHRSGSGAGSTNSGHDSGAQPIGCLFGRTAMSSEEINAALRDSDLLSCRYTSSRLFRPPRF